MALPIINDKPKYEMVIPSTKKKVRFRPFLVKEQKVLLLAFESKDKRGIVRAILDTIESCIEEKIDVYKLATFDVDYAFSQIRAKSVGEVVHLNIDCSKCEVKNEASLNLDKIEVDVKKQNMIVKLTDTISLKFKYPDYNYFINDNKFFTNESDIDSVLDIIISCLDSIQTNDENLSIADEPREEVQRFIESLTADQFEKVKDFINTIPKLTHQIKFKCINCGEENTRIVEGLEDFF